MLSGQLLFTAIAGVVLAAVGAWLVALRYRAAMKRLMREGPVAAAGDDRVEAAVASSNTAFVSGEPAPTFADNRRAAWQLSVAVVAISFAVSGTMTALWLASVDGGSLFSFGRWWLFTLLRGWVAIPVLALLWRWSTPRWLAMALVYAACMFGIAWWRSIDLPLAAVARLVAIDIGPALLLIAFALAGAATRAITPALLLPALGLVAASIAGLELLAALVAERPDWVVSWSLDPIVLFPLFALLPWIVAIWPLRAAARALARGYANKRFSEFSAQFVIVWAIALSWQAIGQDLVLGLTLFVSLSWIPLGLWVLRRWRSPPRRPPLLLVLRVFRRTEVQHLFDRVVARWRLGGNTVLIAGTDLAERTIDLQDVLVFLDRRLAERFVSRPSDVPARIAEFDFGPDDDGRFRINECYCRDSTWREAFAALAARADVVLMDLRGFVAGNAGCRHELESLARSRSPLRAVVVVDARSDRAAAEAAMAGAPADRFVWFEAEGRRVDHRKLIALLVQSPGLRTSIAA